MKVLAHNPKFIRSALAYLVPVRISVNFSY